MSEFIVSARKYRPSTFKSVVGQHSITATLKNALTSGKMGHAYLFTGPRGVGKTSCARIFAKTINCFNLTDEHEPCNECESCTSFNENRSYNIHELDAASNNSVDDIRLITEKVRIKPQLGKYSVYIIDEVHILSTAAFNAFLKTLEEPPEHAIFILATTEKHKILPTILSRCQIFDFNRISVEDAAGHLEYVAKSEGIEVEPEALTVIAQKADGGMRDALSMFDQIVSFSSGEVTYEKVIENLNVLDYEYYFRLIESLFAGNIMESLLVFNEVLEKGFDGHHFTTGLASHLRDLLVCKDETTLKLLEVGASIRERYKEQAKLCSVAWLFRAIEAANKTDLNYKSSQNKRLQVELALMQIAQLNNKLEVEATNQAVAQPKQPVSPSVQEQQAKYQTASTPKQVSKKVDTPPVQKAPQENDELLVCEKIESSILEDILFQFDLHKEVIPNLYTEDKWFVDRPRAGLDDYHQDSGFDFEVIDFNELENFSAVKAYFICYEPIILKPLEDKILHHYGDQITVTYAMPYCLEIMKKGVNKGAALEKVLEQKGLSLKKTIAFGDGLNDYEMLSVAGRPYMMQNATKELKELLPWLPTIGANSDHSVAKFLEEEFKKVLI